MDRFIGIDGHIASCTCAVMGPTGRRIRQEVVKTDGLALKKFIRGVPGSKYVCLEECELSAWMYEVLSPHAEQIEVIQPKRNPGPKSDAIDAWALADMVRRGDRRTSVFKPGTAFTGLREAVRAHTAATHDLVKVKNRIKAVYRSRGLAVNGRDVYDDVLRAKWLKKLPKHYRQRAEIFYAELASVMDLVDWAEEWLLKEARQSAEVKLLTTAPGIAEVRAAQIVSIVVTPHRFRTKAQFWSYCGLAVVTKTSSDWVWRNRDWSRQPVVQTRGLNRNRNAVLKNVFKGAAQTVATLMKTHPLHERYQQLLEGGTKPTLAQVTLARRIASAVLAMWKKKEPYDPKKHVSHTPA